MTFQGKWHDENGGITPDQRYSIDENRTGDARLMQPGRCLDTSQTGGTVFSHTSLGQGLITALPFAISAWFKVVNAKGSTTENAVATYNNNGGGTGDFYGFNFDHQQNLYLLRLNDTSIGYDFVPAQWNHVTAVFLNDTDGRIFLNGVDLGIKSGNSRPLPSTFDAFTIAARNDRGFTYSEVLITDVRLYDDAITPDEAWQIYRNEDLVEAKLLLRQLCDEGGGLITYDSSGNNRDGTLYNTLDSSHYQGTDVPYSQQNEVGYRLSGGVYIPADPMNPGNDVTGNPLDYSGPAPRNAKLRESHCYTFNGVSSYAQGAITGLTGSSATWAFWVKPDSAGNGSDDELLILTGDLGRIDIDSATGDLIFGRDDGDSRDWQVMYAGFAAEFHQTWVHVTVSRVGDTDAQCFINGVQVTNLTGLPTKTPIGDPTGAVIGGNFTTNYANVQMVDVRVFNSQLIPGQVLEIYQNESSIVPELHWPLQDGGQNNLYDVSGNKHTLAVFNHVDSDAWANFQDMFHWNYVRGFDVSEFGNNPDLTGNQPSANGTVPLQWSEYNDFGGSTTWDAATNDGIQRINLNDQTAGAFLGIWQSGQLPTNTPLDFRLRWRLVRIGTIVTNDRLVYNNGAGWPVLHTFSTDPPVEGEWQTTKWRDATSTGNLLVAVSTPSAGGDWDIEFDHISVTYSKDPVDWSGTDTGLGAGPNPSNPAGNWNNNAETLLDFRSEPLAPWHSKVYAGYGDAYAATEGYTGIETLFDDLSANLLTVYFKGTWTAISAHLLRFALTLRQIRCDGSTGALVYNDGTAKQFLSAAEWGDENTLHEVVISIDNNTLNCWLDGTLTGDSPVSVNMLNYNGSSTISAFSAANGTSGLFRGDFHRFRVMNTAETNATALTAPAMFDWVWQDGHIDDLSGNNRRVTVAPGTTFPLIAVPGDPPEFSFNGTLDPEGWTRNYVGPVQEEDYILFSNQDPSEPSPPAQQLLVDSTSTVDTTGDADETAPQQVALDSESTVDTTGDADTEAQKAEAVSTSTVDTAGDIEPIANVIEMSSASQVLTLGAADTEPAKAEMDSTGFVATAGDGDEIIPDQLTTTSTSTVNTLGDADTAAVEQLELTSESSVTTVGDGDIEQAVNMVSTSTVDTAGDIQVAEFSYNPNRTCTAAREDRLCTPTGV